MSSFFAPHSGLPAISPTRGEISSFNLGDYPISPPVGEMSGRTEGGNVEHPSDQNDKVIQR
jgi:hypothetical protein